MAVIKDNGMLIPIIKLAKGGFNLWLMAMIEAVFIEPNAAPTTHILPIQALSRNKIFS